MGDGDTVVEVGADHRKYYINKAVLTRHSEFFATALQGPWREAREGVIILDDIEPAICEYFLRKRRDQSCLNSVRHTDVPTVNLYVHWLYNQELPPTNEWDKWDEVMETPPSSDQEDMIVKLKIYALADRFLDSEFRKATTQSIIEQTDNHRWYSSYVNEFVTWAFENFRFNSPLLPLMVNEFCTYWQEPYVDEDDAMTLRGMPSGFTYRVALRLHEVLLSPRATPHEEACYLEHVSDNELRACSKLLHV